MLITAIFTLTILSIFWVLFLISQNVQFAELPRNLHQGPALDQLDLTVSSDSQPYLIRSLLSGIFMGPTGHLAPHKDSHKNLFQLERTSSLLQSSSFLQQASIFA